MYVCVYAQQTMRLVWAFTRDSHLTKPQDGVGFQEALAEHMCLNLWNVHSEETSLLAPHKCCSVRLSLSPFSRFLTTTERQRVPVASKANQGPWEPPHKYLKPKRQ